MSSDEAAANLSDRADRGVGREALSDRPEPMVRVTRAICLACGDGIESVVGIEKEWVHVPALVPLSAVRDLATNGHEFYYADEPGVLGHCFGQLQIEMEPALSAGKGLHDLDKDVEDACEMVWRRPMKRLVLGALVAALPLVIMAWAFDLGRPMDRYLFATLCIGPASIYAIIALAEEESRR